MPSSYETITLETPAPHVLQVTLARPEAANALNTQMGRDLLGLWVSLSEDAADVRCVVLTAQGDSVFSAGGDLKERNSMDAVQWRQQHELFERMYWALVDLPIPVIAAVNGHAYGGGLEMVLCCDFAYASETARFALPESKLGIMPGGGGTQNLPRAIGERKAKELMMTGRPFSAQEALDWGVINHQCRGSLVLAQALETASTIAQGAPLSMRQIKKSVRYGGQMELRTAYRFEVEAYNHLVDTDDRREGVAAFNEKRKPVFKGR